MNALDLVSLDGKTALMTDFRRGIGKAMAITEARADIMLVSAVLSTSLIVYEQNHEEYL